MSLEDLFDKANCWMQQTAVGGRSNEKVTSNCGAITWHNSCAMQAWRCHNIDETQAWRCHNIDETHSNKLSLSGQKVSSLADKSSCYIAS